MAGKELLHGPHHDAQKSRRMTDPFSLGGSFPSSLNAARSGMASPSFRPAMQKPGTASAMNAMRERRTAGRSCGHIGRKPPGLMPSTFRGDAGLRLAVRLQQVEAVARPKDECGCREN